MPVALLTDNGTSGPAELFAAALTGNKRASLVGERTLGRAARQRLVQLPDGSGLLLTHLLYLTPGEAVINEKGLTPDVAVEQPDVEFGEPLPTTDATLDKAIEHLKKAIAYRRRSRARGSAIDRTRRAIAQTAVDARKIGRLRLTSRTRSRRV